MLSCRLPLVILFAIGVSTALAQSEPAPDNPVDTAPGTMRENVRRLVQTLSQISSWDEERENMLNAAGKVFETNGWNSESDLFVLDLMSDMEQLPPTAFQQRFDTMVGALSDRYMLSETQEQTMRRTIARESQDLFMKHSGRIMQYGLEALQTRIAGEPFTPEQVARWVELAEPVFLDARERVKVAAERFMGELDPEQQELLRRDLEADNLRAERMLEMAEGWKRGEWKSSDWGLDEDPIQTAGEARRAAAASGAGQNPTADKRATPGQPDAETPGGETPVAEDPTAQPAVGSPANPPPTARPGRAAAPAGDNDPWAQHVRNFIARYGLGDDQQQRAWRIYDEVKSHRDNLRKRHAQRETDKSTPNAPAAAEAPAGKEKAALDRLFEQLNRRLERLPTRAQRKAAAATPPKPAANSEKPADKP